MKKIIVPVGFKVDDIALQLNTMKKELKGLRMDSTVGNQLIGSFSKVENEVDKIQKKIDRGVSSFAEIDSLERSTQIIAEEFEKIQKTVGRISFKDLTLTKEQTDKFKQLNHEIKTVDDQLKQFKKTQIKKLFDGNDTAFVRTMRDQLNLTAETVTGQKGIEDSLNKQLKSLKQQTAETEKLILLQQKQQDARNNQKTFEDWQQQFGNNNQKAFKSGQADAGRAAAVKIFQDMGADQETLDRVQEGSFKKIQAIYENFATSVAPKMDQALATNRTSLIKLTKQSSDVEQAMIELRAAMTFGEKENLETKLENLTEALKAEQQAVLAAALANLNGFVNSAKAGGKAANEYKSDIEALNGALTTEQRAQDIFSRVQAGVSQLIGLGAVMHQVSKGIHLAINQIRELDSAMNSIAVVTDFSTEELWKQIDVYMAMAKQYGVTTAGTYEVSQLYYQQGLDTAEVMDLTAETLKMARIAGLDYAKATDYMTVALNGFKLSAEDAGRVVDIYSRLAGIAATDTAELAEAMSKTASIADSAGMSIESTSAMLTMMIETTREAPELK